MAPARTLTLRARIGQRLLAFGSKVKRLITMRLVTGQPPGDSDPELAALTATYPVVVYFADTPARAYQVLQWVPVLERIALEHPVVIASRRWTTTELLRDTTSVPVVFCRTLDALMSFYDHVDAKVVLYPNNGVRNFQSLIYRRGLHVHINHGESDKVSMVSNQAKAYDHVVIAGRAALDRHRRALINFDHGRLVVCGRPQLDLDLPSLLRPDPDRHTVLYAPTWWGENEANNYTSLDVFGTAIVRAVLARPGTRLIYKPHPRVTTAGDGPVVEAHRQILRMMAAANDDLGDRVHRYLPDADILGVFDGVDLLVTDVSSVGLDFLYLRSDAPIILTDRRTDHARLAEDAPISSATDVIDRDTVGEIARMIDANLADDPRVRRRAEMRDYYFGFERGESSRRFMAFIESAIRRRDELVGALPVVRPGEAERAS